MKSRNLITTMVLSLLLVICGCAGKTVPETDANAAPVISPAMNEPTTIEEAIPETATAAPEEVAPMPAKPEHGKLETVYFEYDSSLLSTQTKQFLAANAQWLQANPQAKATLEGYCDERGSDGYNLALGERRAQEAKKYLAELGVAPERLGVISYGEERPAMIGHDEIAWQMNRRVEFK